MQICYLYPEWKEVYDKYHLREKNEATCYYTKLNYKEDVLGFGNKNVCFHPCPPHLKYFRHPN